MSTPGGQLREQALRGAAWSGISTVVMRLSSLCLGILLARLLEPKDFGVYAVALTVQAILITVADLGLSADIIRTDDPERIAPTVASLGLISGSVLALSTALFSTSLAVLLGSPEAGPAIAILGMTLFFAGASVVPFGLLARRFQQRAMFLVSVADFLVSTTVTLSLIHFGWGVLSLAVGRVAAQTASSALQFKLAGTFPRYGLDRSVIGPVLRFGLPIASANMLSWALLNADNIVLARVAGAASLGYYVLAFNISSWPMSALSQVVRSISLPYFARSRDEIALQKLIGLAWAAALPAGAMLATFSGQVVEVVYGRKWLPAAAVLAALGLYGSLRVIFDVLAGYLYARGKSRPVLWIQIAYLAVLMPGLYWAASRFGIVGAGWVHVVVSVSVILPAYSLAIRGEGVKIRPIILETARPTFAILPAIIIAWLVKERFVEPFWALVTGGASGAIVYMIFVWPWLNKRIGLVRSNKLSPLGGSEA